MNADLTFQHADPTRQIDFLPASYRVQHAERRSHFWRITIVLCVITVIGTMSYAQRRTRQHLQTDLDIADRMLTRSVMYSEKLSGIESKIHDAETRAELLTCLRRPWPRTQILKGIVGPLPESVRLTKIAIHRRSAASSGQPSRSATSRSPNKKEAESAEESPAGATLRALLLLDESTTIEVDIEGVSYDSRALHRFLAKLADNPLLNNPELLDLERVVNDGEVSYPFTARISVVPPPDQQERPSLETRAGQRSSSGRRAT